MECGNNPEIVAYVDKWDKDGRKIELGDLVYRNRILYIAELDRRTRSKFVLREFNAEMYYHIRGNQLEEYKVIDREKYPELYKEGGYEQIRFIEENWERIVCGI